MPSQSPPLALISQSFEATAMPERGEGVHEAMRLHAALFGAYEYVLMQKPHYQFRSAVVCNPETPVFYEGQGQFKVEESVNGSERTLMLERISDEVSLECVEVIPMGINRNPLDYSTLEASAKRRMVRYWQDDSSHELKIRLSGLNIFEVESVNACV